MPKTRKSHPPSLKAKVAVEALNLCTDVEGARHGLGKTLALRLDEAMIHKEMPCHLGPQPCRLKLLQFYAKFCLAAGSCTSNEIITCGGKFAPSIEGAGTYQDRFQLLDSLVDVFHL